VLYWLSHVCVGDVIEFATMLRLELEYIEHVANARCSECDWEEKNQHLKLELIKKCLLVKVERLYGRFKIFVEEVQMGKV